jgi:drug/metabolite transporter (DMT)-like permease
LLPGHLSGNIAGMFHLLTASLLWAFSFGLIKRFLPALDPWWVAAVRLSLAALVFAPWTWRYAPSSGLRLRAVLLGALQFGAMYTLYIASFRFLAAWQVALWTIFTPIMVVLLDQLRHRRNPWLPLLMALLAVGGAALAQGRWPEGETLRGVLLVQGSNVCFAVGQLGYRTLARAAGATTGGEGGSLTREAGLLGWMYLGGALLTTAGWLLASGYRAVALPSGSLPALLYLGLLPTAVGFWLWNAGAVRTTTGRLAVANNLKVPLAILVAWLVFGESVPLTRAAAGLAVLILALCLTDSGTAERRPRAE